MIRAVYRDGTIKPLDTVPTEWRDGQELEVREPQEPDQVAGDENWLGELQAAAAKIPDAIHTEIAAALDRHEAESKELMRREMEATP